METGRKPTHFVYLLDGGRVGFVGVGRQDRTPIWRAVWQHRHELGSPLAEWLATLKSPPTEHIILGAGVGLHWATAQGVARLVAGWFPNCVVEDRMNMGGAGRRIGRVEADGALTIFPTIAAAAAALRTTRFGVHKALRVGRLLDAGPNRGWQRR